MLEMVPRNGLDQGLSWRLIDLLTAHVPTLSGRTIAVVGLATAPDSADSQGAPALELIGSLLAAGARVRVAGPIAQQRIAARSPEVVLVADAYAAAMGADAVLLLTEQDVSWSLDLDHLANAMWSRILIDASSGLDPEAVAAAGLQYERLDLTTPAPRHRIFIEQWPASAAD